MNYFPLANFLLWFLATCLWSRLNWFMFGLCTAGLFVSLYSFIEWALGDEK